MKGVYDVKRYFSHWMTEVEDRTENFFNKDLNLT